MLPTQRVKRSRTEMAPPVVRTSEGGESAWLRFLKPWKRDPVRDEMPAGGEVPFGEEEDNLALQLPPVPTLTPAGLPSFTGLVNYADHQLGAHVIFATDEYKCNAANILTDHPQLNWTTRRRRIVGHDWCLIKLPVPVIIRGVQIETTDDAPPHISLEAALDVKNITHHLYCKLQANYPDVCPRGADSGCLSAGSVGLPAEVQQTANKVIDMSATWRNVIEVSPVKRNQVNYFEVTADEATAGGDLKVDLIRLNLLPDGGLARLKVFGECALNIGPIHKLKERESATKMLDYASAVHGGHVCYATAGSSSAFNLIYPMTGANDAAWITPRQPLRPMFIQQPAGDADLKFHGSESAVIALASRCIVSSVDICTAGIHADLPYKILLSMFDSSEVRKLPMLRQTVLFSRFPEEIDWFEFGALEELGGDEEYTVTLNSPMPATHLRVVVVPDGGVCRVRVNGRFCDLEIS